MPSARPKSAKSLRKCGTQKQETTTSTTPDEDIDYHITFPTNFNTDFIEHELITDFVKGKKVDEKGERDYKVNECFGLPQFRIYPDPDEFENDTVYIGEKKKEPVVILLAWLDADDSELVSYSKLYDKHGCITIRYSADKEVVVFRSTQLHKPAKLILELLKDLNLDEHPIFIHTFSDTGAMLYRYITEYMHMNKEYWGIKLAGVIFDSAPTKYSYKTAVSGIAASVRRYDNVYSSVTPAVWLYALVYVCVCALKNAMSCRRQRVNLQFDYYHALTNDPSHSPQLFLYSENDSRIVESDIIETMDYRKKAGRKVEMHKFMGTGGHSKTEFQNKCAEYAKICVEFVECCLFDMEMEIF